MFHKRKRMLLLLLVLVLPLHALTHLYLLVSNDRLTGIKGQTAERQTRAERRTLQCRVQTFLTSSALNVSSPGYSRSLEKTEVNTDVCRRLRDNLRIQFELKRRLSSICTFCGIRDSSLQPAYFLPRPRVPPRPPALLGRASDLTEFSWHRLF